MTNAARKVAAALKAIMPELDPSGSVLDQNEETVEAQRRMWGVCVGAIVAALVAENHVGYSQRIEFYRLCGVEVYD
jgi:hypothetical protein